ncbi:MAG: hypothetical protein BWK74_01895 [Desulfobacteraceae bacterium A6]|nr:MAG: hypothetical protein BWK74_01895 [Desulfobacteraceae bacterium A6]
MEVGQQNKNKQVLMRKTERKSTTHRFARIWVMHCKICDHEYGSNSCDAHERHCPHCNSDANLGEPL